MSAEAIYRHPNPGAVLTLFDKDGVPVISKAGKSNAIFKDTGGGLDRCGICVTDDAAVQSAIENSKPFKNGVIVRLKSADDIAYESKKRDQELILEQRKKDIASGLLGFDVLKGMNEQPLRDFADSIGIEINSDKGKRKKVEILYDIQKTLFPITKENE